MNKSILYLRIFLPFAAGYFLSYLFRVVNAVIAENLIADLHLAPSGLGALTSVYFITFALLQLPLGILLDRYGPRKVESLLLLVAASGAAVFSQATTLSGLLAGRALIGFGVAACLMAAFKAFTLWFKSDKWPFINGLQMASGGVGALVATYPVEAALMFTSWRTVFLFLAILTLLVAILIYVIVPENDSCDSDESLQTQIQGIREVFTNPVFWRMAPLATMSQATFLSIQGLWAGPWLTYVAGLNRQDTAQTLFVIALSMIAGFIMTGFAAQRLQRHGIKVATTAVFMMTCFIIVQGILLLTASTHHPTVWIIFGFSGTSGIIAYSALSQSFPHNLSGRVTTALNLMVFIAAFLGQWFIGVVIDFFSTKQQTSFAKSGFIAAFGFLLLLELAGLLWYMIKKDHDVPQA